MAAVLAIFDDYTLRTVLMGAVLLGLVSGVLSVFTVLRRQSLMGDALSHAALPGICAGFVVAGGRSLGWIMAGALVSGALAALFVLALTRTTRIKTDAATGAALSLFFAAGVVALTRIQQSGGAAQAGLEGFLFGQAASLLRADLWPMALVAGLAIGAIAVLWKEVKLVTFDPVFAQTLGLPVLAIEAALSAMVALAVVVGLQMVGVVLMAAMVIAPAVAARQWTRQLGPMTFLAAGFGVAAGAVGSVISALGPGLATGPLIVLVASAIVGVSLAFAPERGLVWERIERRRARRRLRGRQVLTTLLKLAQHHRDPEYPAEETMIDTYHGLPTRRLLERLDAEALVERTDHMANEGRHWRLTPQGLAEAERVLAAPTSAAADAASAEPRR